MIQILCSVAGVFALAGSLIWSMTRIRYGIGETHFKVSWLGVTVRRVRLTDIRGISSRPVFVAERWYNTLAPGKRLLVIRRRSGWMRNFCITPRNHMVFKADLERARRLAFLSGAPELGGLRVEMSEAIVPLPQPAELGVPEQQAG